MRLIDERGKLWGVINPLDLLLIIGLVILGWRTISKLRPVAQTKQQINVTYGILVRNVPPYLAKSITVGQELYHSKQQAYLGKVVAKQVTPAELILPEVGRLVRVSSPVNLDLRLKMRRNGRIIIGTAGSGIYLGKKAIRVGEKFSAQTRYTILQGEVEYLRVKSDVP